MLIIALYCMRLVTVQKRLRLKMRKSTVIMLAAMMALLSGTADSTFYVKPGQSIQTAINAASPGKIIEVQNGTYHERVNVTKQLTLKGVGEPVVDAGGDGSAITISANGSTLLGFTAIGSGKGWNDAGIRVLSRENVIKGNAAMKNNNFGILFYHAGNNTVANNVAEENKNSGIMLVHSNDNQVWGNNIVMNRDGISIQTSRGNVVKANNLTENKIGINISAYNFSESIRVSTSGNGKGVSIKYHPTDGATTYNIDKNSTSLSPDSNLLFQNNLLYNSESAFDDGYNQWDNGKVGNHYSSYDAREQGCKDRNRDAICDSGYSIPGGHGVDKLPKASIDAILSYKSKGLMGSELKIDHRTYLPGSDVDVMYLAPKNFSGWVGVVRTNLPRGYADQKKSLSHQRIAGSSGLLNLKAPAENGSYNLRMYNASGEDLASLNFSVNVPIITAAPVSVNACEMVTVKYSGAPGYENDWIAMYKSGSPDGSYVTRQYLNGNENGTVTLEAPDPGSYDFRIFENDSFTKLATSNNIEAKAMAGNKVIASPSHVGPGGTVTVTYWGAPPEGTGVIGMYGMNRPDKFYLGMRPIGSKSCGSITWRLPSDPGQYDFRMFRSEITDVGQGAYQILGQSNAVTVG
jgi:nitrous oxidase accessory protein